MLALIRDKAFSMNMPPRKELRSAIVSAAKKTYELVGLYEKISMLYLHYAAIYSDLEFDPFYSEQKNILLDYTKELSETSSKIASVNEHLKVAKSLLPNPKGGRKPDDALSSFILKIYPFYKECPGAGGTAYRDNYEDEYKGGLLEMVETILVQIGYPYTSHGALAEFIINTLEGIPKQNPSGSPPPT